MTLEINTVYNVDCIDLMREMERQGIVADWLIADPPYGINVNMGAGVGEGGGFFTVKESKYSKKEWDKNRLTQEYFDLMFKVSKNQIIFGGNYYTDILPPTKSWIVWNKRSYNLTDRNDFADCELAWCSKGVARIFNYMYNGALQGDMKNKEERFHPTQKPTQIICQLLNYYTQENDLIIDPFMGSFTTAVACHKLKRNFIGAELDKEYFDLGYKRLHNVQSQLDIWHMED